ncbi:MAG: galactose ABC transporter substrate-binding protein [Ruminococcaceae bacterium]|nr:galactose ABC transporter substrate-binding protein [Oscillospiraceae bacterium]
MNKIICAIICVAMLVSLTACSSGGGSGASDAHVFYYSYSDTYISNVRSALGRAFSANNIKYHDYDSNSNQTTQTEQVQTAITQGTKVLVVNIVNTGSDDAAQGIISQAKGASLPIIFFNREVSDEAVNSYDKCVFIGTDAKEAGHMQGEMIGEYLIENYDAVDLNGDGKISYIMFKGEEGNNEAIYRTQYAVEDANAILTQNGKPELMFYDASNPNKYLVDKNGQWSAAAANEYMTTALTSYNEANNNMIELVICNNDGMAEGAITALNSAGYNTGDEKSIPVFGVDATDAARELIKNKKMTGTILQDAEGMAEAIAMVTSNAIEGIDLLSGTDDFQKDSASAKLRIPYSKYLGEDL